MALVSTVDANWVTITGKNLTRQSALTSRLKEAVIDFAIGMCNYPACDAGYVVDLSACGRICTVIDVKVDNVVVSCNELLVTQYAPSACNVAATGTLHLFESLNTCAGGNAPLAEIPACAADVACTTIQFHIIGF